jgi:prepilin-type N-terminal cleavage/methylation domain-containing protein
MDSPHGSSGAMGEQSFEVRRLTSAATKAESAFTLIELLVVIAIIGILAAIAMPTLNQFKPDISAVAARQLLNDISHARHVAIAQRTTVYMVFCPTNIQGALGYGALPANEKLKADRLLEKQGVAYTFVSLRDVGDQPGHPTPRYWGQWRTLPQGAYIAPMKFDPNAPDLNIYTNTSVLAFQVHPFPSTNNIPFPSDEVPGTQFVPVSYLAFNYMGQLVVNGSVVDEELIPIVKGTVQVPRDPTTKIANGVPTFTENPIGNGTNNFNIVKIEGITGRPHVEKLPIQ